MLLILSIYEVEKNQSAYLQGTASKQVKNVSKTAVMDIIGVLCASLHSTTVQLHDSLGSRHTCACSEAGFSAMEPSQFTFSLKKKLLSSE
jgi:hypothetical protein